MKKIHLISLAAAAALTLSTALSSCTRTEKKRPPNIIYILADDLSWGDLGCFGQTKIMTPNIDRIATEGMKFTQAYAGNSVCAPSRSCLMEGKHPGHARVRGNSYKSYRESLQKGDFTVAMLLKQAGYSTGLFGKWGLSNFDQPGIPNEMGFDEFYGYLNQQQAHCYYPEFLYHNRERVYFPENGEHHKLENYKKTSPYDEDGKVRPLGIDDPEKAVYSFDFYSEKALDFIREHKDAPFYLNLSYTIPHGSLIVPDLGIYKDKDWPIKNKEWAAMITRMDTHVGKLLSLLKELGLDEETIIFFSSDNGNAAHQYADDFVDFFDLDSPTKGRKGNSYDGAFHVPAMARWPQHIAPGQVSDHIWAFWDFLPTAGELAGVAPPPGLDGISIVPTLLGKEGQRQHEFLYWEFNGDQAVRAGNWFARRVNGNGLELYDLTADPKQEQDLSAGHPDIANQMKEIMTREHVPSDVWPSPGETPEAFQQRLKEQNVPERPNNISNY